MPRIELTNITKHWKNFYAVDDLSMVIEDNAFVTLLGPSGCGKTTTLRMIAGLETPTEGRITIGDTVVFDSAAGINIPANKRKVGFLFQNYALWPNMTVYDNISFGLKNVKEELPVRNMTAVRLSGLIKALAKPEEIRDIILESADNRGRVDQKRALIRLIDKYEISMSAAKELWSYKLHEENDVRAAAATRLTRLEADLQAEKNKAAAAGYTWTEDFCCLKDGKPVTETRKLTKEEIDLTVRRVARIVKIGMFMERYPAELSGGQQQRVAIARTLAPEPKVLFMDEPLSNLDAKLRLEMRSELQRLHLETGSTFIYVTHDQMEAMTLASKICLIENGNLQQYDVPLNVYNYPENIFAADFVGNPSINLIEAKGKVSADGKLALEAWAGRKMCFTPVEPLDLEAWYAEYDRAEAAKKAKLSEKAARKGYVAKGNKDTLFKYNIAMVEEPTVTSQTEVTREDFVIGVRPEQIKLNPDGKLTGEVYSAMPTGMETTVIIRVGNFLLTAVVFGGILYEIGSKVNFDIVGSRVCLFSRQNGRRITLGELSVN
ncbi:ABC transporter ATP-binding protein [Mageeibacillus indolicus]|uniref:ABC transporter ATP-binding protein n=1 Tax=Mageeibacillus indolicus TaxID=884684 RepID=A0A2J8B248_9FIRM|nr:ABC transporter ATP-binding protein [Mageeibacillus indolicus]PNH18843.1 ABC transporter ATP-binding protein [Mageeibacillus indolicus]